MARLGAIFVGICLVAVAAAIGAALLVLARLDLWAAALGGGAAALLLAAVVTFRARGGERGNRQRERQQEHMADLSRGASALARQVAVMDRRLSAIEERLDGALARIGSVTEPLAQDLVALGARVERLAHEAKARAAPAVVAALTVDVPAAPQPTREPTTPAAPAATAATLEEMAGVVARAFAEKRIELHLQPVVALEQRKVIAYEALSRLRAHAGELIPAQDFIAAAERAGSIAQIDLLAVTRALQVLRRFRLKNGEVGLFCNLSRATLTDVAVTAPLLDLLRANRALAPALTLELPQEVWRTLSFAEISTLSQLAELGFGFSIDHVVDLHFDLPQLAQRRVRAVRIPASALLAAAAGSGADGAAFALCAALTRAGIGVIGEKVENEMEVLGLIELDVRMGQGLLFSAPRPVRADVLQPRAAPEFATTDQP